MNSAAAPKVLLINPPVRTYAQAQCHPLNLIYLASALRQNGIASEILDVNGYRWPANEVLKRIDQKDFSIIGIGGIITTFKYVKWLTRELKRRYPQIPIVLGGQVASPIAPLWLERTPADVVAHGNAEITLPRLVDALARGSDELHLIPGISFRRQGRLIHTGPPQVPKNLDDLALPAYDLIDVDRYATSDPYGGSDLDDYLRATGRFIANRRGLLVLLTRGCSGRCSFCIHEKEFPGFKVHSVRYAADHIEYLYRNYGIRVFGLGEEFVLRRSGRWFRQFLDAIEARGMDDCVFSPGARADSIPFHALNEFHRRGVFRIGFGFESGDQRILDTMLKGVTVEQNIMATRKLKSHGFPDTNSFMVGMPGENLESIKNTCRVIKSLKIGSGGLFYATAYPGSILYDWARAKGLIADEEAYLDSVSDKDASRIHLNLTFYPNFILRFFHDKVALALLDTQKLASMPWKTRIKVGLLRLLFPYYETACRIYLHCLHKKEMDPVANGRTDGLPQMSKFHAACRFKARKQ